MESVVKSAKGAFHISLGRSPGIPLHQAKGLKARSIISFETASADGAYLPSKDEAQSDLNLARPVRLRGDRSEAGARHLHVRGAKRSMVQEIENLDLVRRANSANRATFFVMTYLVLI